MAEHQLPKLNTRVRFPSSAPSSPLVERHFATSDPPRADASATPVLPTRRNSTTYQRTGQDKPSPATQPATSDASRQAAEARTPVPVRLLRLIRPTVFVTAHLLQYAPRVASNWTLVLVSSDGIGRRPKRPLGWGTERWLQIFRAHRRGRVCRIFSRASPLPELRRSSPTSFSRTRLASHRRTTDQSLRSSASSPSLPRVANLRNATTTSRVTKVDAQLPQAYAKAGPIYSWQIRRSTSGK